MLLHGATYDSFLICLKILCITSAKVYLLPYWLTPDFDDPNHLEFINVTLIHGSPLLCSPQYKQTGAW